MSNADIAVPAFGHRRAGHCASGSLRDITAHHGLDFGCGALSEGMCLGLGSGLGFLYAVVPDVQPPIYLVGRTESLEEEFARNLGIGLDVRDTDDADTGLAWLREELDRGRPPIVWADIAELEYLRVRMSNTRHAIVIAGLDIDAGIAWIADNDREDLQACSLESLARARSSDGFPDPNHHRTFVYDWPRQLDDPAPAIRQAIAGAVTNMREGGMTLGGIDAPAGLSGVDAFAADYPLWPERYGQHLDAILGVLSVFIVKAGTGGALFRSLYAEFLHDASTLLDDAALADLARTADRLAASWRALADGARAGDHAAGKAHIQAIVAGEHALTDELDTWLKT